MDIEQIIVIFSIVGLIILFLFLINIDIKRRKRNKNRVYQKREPLSEDEKSRIKRSKFFLETNSFLNKEKIHLTEDFFLVNGTQHKYFEVTNLYFNYLKSSFNFIAMERSIKLIVYSREEVLFELTSSGSFNKKKCESIESAYLILRDLTFKNRYLFNVGELRIEGRLKTNEVVLSLDGNITKGNRKVNLHEAKQIDGIQIGSFIGDGLYFNYSRPNNIKIKNRFGKINFDAYCDGDIIPHLLQYILNYKSTKEDNN